MVPSEADMASHAALESKHRVCSALLDEVYPCWSLAYCMHRPSGRVVVGRKVVEIRGDKGVVVEKMGELLAWGKLYPATYLVEAYWFCQHPPDHHFLGCISFTFTSDHHSSSFLASLPSLVQLTRHLKDRPCLGNHVYRLSISPPTPTINIDRLLTFRAGESVIDARDSTIRPSSALVFPAK